MVRPRGRRGALRHSLRSSSAQAQQELGARSTQVLPQVQGRTAGPGASPAAPAALEAAADCWAAPDPACVPAVSFQAVSGKVIRRWAGCLGAKRAWERRRHGSRWHCGDAPRPGERSAPHLPRPGLSTAACRPGRSSSSAKGPAIDIGMSHNSVVLHAPCPCQGYWCDSWGMEPRTRQHHCQVAHLAGCPSRPCLAGAWMATAVFPVRGGEPLLATAV
jgi:hypothetical protein